MDHGSVAWNGIKIELTQEAYCNNAGQYLASGVDDKGNKYLVEWATTAAWDQAQEDAKGGEITSFAEDESNACDWLDPVNVKLVESAE